MLRLLVAIACLAGCRGTPGRPIMIENRPGDLDPSGEPPSLRRNKDAVVTVWYGWPSSRPGGIIWHAVPGVVIERGAIATFYPPHDGQWIDEASLPAPTWVLVTRFGILRPDPATAWPGRLRRQRRGTLAVVTTSRIPIAPIDLAKKPGPWNRERGGYALAVEGRPFLVVPERDPPKLAVTEAEAWRAVPYDADDAADDCLVAVQLRSDPDGMPFALFDEAHALVGLMPGRAVIVPDDGPWRSPAWYESFSFQRCAALPP